MAQEQQSNPARARMRSAGESSVIPIDTGAFSVWRHDFTRFTNPGMCVAAAHNATAVARRDPAMQYQLLVLRDSAPQRDTLPRGAVTIAQQCGRRFALATTAPADLPFLQTLALLANDDNTARAVVERQLALAKDATGRQRVLKVAADSFMAAAPARIALAEWAAAKADSLALAEHTTSLDAHLALLQSAQRAFDRTRMTREADKLLHLGQTLQFNTIREHYSALTLAWMNLLQVAYYERLAHPDSVMALVRQAKDYMSPFPVVPFGWLMMFDYKRHTLAETREYLMPFDPGKYTGTHAVPPIEAPYWYPAKPTSWPPANQVTLVLYGGATLNCARSDDKLMGWGAVSRDCAALHTYLPSWTKAYASQGLALTLVERTYGEAVRSVPLSPAQEADSVAWFYLHYLNLPATTVAVVPRVLAGRVPQDADGRRWTADTTAFGRLLAKRVADLPPWDGWDRQVGMALLYGRDGRLIYAGMMDFRSEHNGLEAQLIQALMQQALDAPSTSSDRHR
jgi:hypothetical protein